MWAGLAARDAELRRHVHEMRNRVCLHLPHHAAAVGLHRYLADVELRSDLLVQKAADDERHDLPFTAGERVMTLMQRPHCRLFGKRGRASFDRKRYGIQQRFGDERFGQELHGARLHGPDRHRHIAVGRDEDDGHLDPLGSQAPLKLETVEVRKRHVEHEAARCRNGCARQKRLCGREGQRMPARRIDEQLQ
jgi:hypothetical protein